EVSEPGDLLKIDIKNFEKIGHYVSKYLTKEAFSKPLDDNNNFLSKLRIISFSHNLFAKREKQYKKVEYLSDIKVISTIVLGDHYNDRMLYEIKNRPVYSNSLIEYQQQLNNCLEEYFSGIEEVRSSELSKSIKKQLLSNIEKEFNERVNDILHSVLKIITERSSSVDFSLSNLYSHLKNNHHVSNLVELLKKHNLIHLSGAAGTGKTTLLADFIRMSNLNKDEVILLGPTGKSVQVIKEKLPSYQVFTIHKALQSIKWNNYPTFLYNAFNNLNFKYVIIDEISFLNTYLLLSILLALPDDVKIIVSGQLRHHDFNVSQLPPVHGHIIQDFIDTYFMKYELKQSFRNSPKVEQKIKQYFSDKGDFIRSNIITMEQFERILTSFTKSSFDFYRDYCILTDLRKFSNQINLSISQPYKDGEFQRFRVGDRVMNCVNNSIKEITNGLIGKVIKIDKNFITVKYPYDVTVTYDERERRFLQHAYAFTVHKSQGSEYGKGAIFLFSTSMYQKYGDSLIYTALSRFKEDVDIYFVKYSKNKVKWSDLINNNECDNNEN
ncbi:MAG: ATP-dependent DNA helicase, partial [Candidatus Odinarchaeia archaeon]